ncbi:helix-turn-helix transcriptional regulator [Agrobacterium vitis]|uniref:helix-turn-helix domain-containing protein n=1 Tax=Allorhizobium ampelinum TaxID=3025782 RepID=UPI001F3078C3|nr:helix-turn-helix transcriptional regulator [Allorhizobium ampelinum]MCF1470580.1 helix-turn-helix transcriptional regulator [Allorhizobium ampelinum]
MVSFSGNVTNSTWCHNRNMKNEPNEAQRRASKIYLKEWLDFRGMTAERLADHLDVSKGTISKLMNGKQRYNQDWMEKIAFALNCDVPDLYFLPSRPAFPSNWNAKSYEIFVEACKLSDSEAEKALGLIKVLTSRISHDQSI